MSISQIINESQNFLSIGQAVPFIGSSFLSPVKAGLSVAQTIYGLAKGIFFNISSHCSSHNKQALIDKSLQALDYARAGLVQLGYSIINFYTLGFVGLCVESAKRIPRDSAIALPSNA